MAAPVEVDLDLDAPGLSAKLPPRFSTRRWQTMSVTEAIALTRYERARERALQGIAPAQATRPKRTAARARRSRRSTLRGPPGSDRPREPRPADPAKLRAQLARERKKERLRKKDVQVALKVWKLVSEDRARNRLKYPPLKRDTAPFTAGFLSTNARTLGWEMDERRAGIANQELLRRRKLRRAGRYIAKKTHGFSVPLYRLPPGPASVRKTAPVKARRSAARRRGWWEGGAFGMPDGRPPPGVRKTTLVRWRSVEHREWEKARGRAFA